jgi:diguanylate cyclase (GGDEF)-like protein
MTAAGEILFAVTDLVYYYEYFYSTYDPNTLLDAIYVIAFGLIAIASYHKGFHKKSTYGLTMNFGQKRKGLYLFIVPVVIIIFKGFLLSYLILSIIIILIYNLLTKYIQSNIHKEILLYEEKEINNKLEQLVNERTRELTEKNQTLEELLNHDIVTKLKNRRYLLNYLDNTIQTVSEKETVLLLYIDISRFKMISTMFGHFAADQILSEMARRLEPLTKEIKNSILASYSEDIFILTAKGDYDYEDGFMLAQKAVLLSSDIYNIDNYQLRITINIGMSIYPLDAKTKEELIKHADIAMSDARGTGFNTIREFDEKLKDSFYHRNLLEVMLKKVDLSKEFLVYYQPQLHAGSGKLIGFEALLRWKTASGEFISPSEFIPIAEANGLIISIGDYVMRIALMQLAEWNKNKEDKLFLGINVSIKQLNTAWFTQQLYSEIERLNLRPEWIDIEITESLQPEDNPEAIKTLQELRSHGMSVSIDDFGTGFSSLSYLKNLPVDRIKIARELISSVHIDDFDYLMIKSIIEISRAKNIKVIAEGIETEEQWEALKELQCDEVQGFLFGKPMPALEAAKLYKLNLEQDEFENQFIYHE